MPGPEINTPLNLFAPITLEEMSSIRLMNRMDTKFLFPRTLLPALLEKLSTSYRILEIEQNRALKYSSRYLDTDDMLFFNQHVTGKLARFKVRYRKYESTGATFLEIKKKTNKNRTIKWRIEDTISNGMLGENASLFIKKHIPFNSFILQPNLDNMFTRISLAHIEAKERITIDFFISYTAIGGESTELPYLAIGEIKSEGYPSKSPFLIAVRQMGIQPTGFSKYCMGNALLKDIPKKNILKQKLLLLNKIENEYSKFNVS
jgi:hypothetical protein